MHRAFVQGRRRHIALGLLSQWRKEGIVRVGEAEKIKERRCAQGPGALQLSSTKAYEALLHGESCQL